MDRPPRRTDAAILDLRRASRLLIFAAVMVIGTVGVLVWGRDTYGEPVGLTMAFTTFVLFQIVNVFNARTEHTSALSGYSFTNPRLWGAITGVTLLQVAVVHVAFLQDVFTTTSLTAGQWLVCAAVALTVLVVEELRKLAARTFRRR